MKEYFSIVFALLGLFQIIIGDDVLGVLWFILAVLYNISLNVENLPKKK